MDADTAATVAEKNTIQHRRAALSVSAILAVQSSVSHEGLSLTTTSDFMFKISKYTELAGYSKVFLYMPYKDHNDMDVVVQIRKTDKNSQTHNSP
ncbi:uncharacterized protein BJX67DRAFT_385390 [Aspergillus lucknowensis]|uniref:Uncharacterized protein n=1 Tax=Aspergillus lucknowensis TaxID=176173 RepID=A0ABR4LH42_9EURO